MPSKFALTKTEADAVRQSAAHEPRVLLWDIEATGLNAVFGTILCIGFMWLDDKKPTVFTILDAGGGKQMLNDKHVVQRFAAVYNTADVSVTWYGDRYDLPMVRTKCLKHNLPPLAPVKNLDLWKAVRFRFKLHNNRLASWQQFLKTEHEKTNIDFDAWLAAAHGDKRAMAEVVDHCAKDVLALRDQYRKLKPWISEQPDQWTFTGKEACPSCGSYNFTRQGTRTSLTRVYQQYRCKACGHWFRDAHTLGSAPFRSSPS